MRLSPCEHEVIKRVVDGESLKVIADALGMSTQSASFHLCNVRRKLGARTNTHAAVIFDRVQRIAA